MEENDVKSGETSYKVILVLGVMTFLMFPSQALAKDGWYMGMDLGFAMAPEMDVSGMDNDLNAVCDRFINPQELGVLDCARRGDEGDPWTNMVDGGIGMLAGLALGYRRGNFRVEGEYFYRTTTYDERSETSTDYPRAEKKEEDELETLDGGVDDVLSHNFFANLYYDFNSNSRVTPYVGVGVGVAQVSLDYFNRWKRNANPATIEKFGKTSDGDRFDHSRIPEEDRLNLHRTLAGTTTIADRKLTDTLFGYQILAGVDYRVSEPVSIGLKFRWADFGEFESERHEWDQLRSHDSHNRRGVRVRYKVMTDDIQFWGLSLNMKYAF